MFNSLRVRIFYLFVVVNVLLLFVIEVIPYGNAKAWGEVNEATASNGASSSAIDDPFEATNRIMFEFNDKFYFWVIKPLSAGYSAFVGEDERVVVGNFFHNLLMPVRLVNSLLQLKFDEAGIELARFGINTTIGVWGLGDVATGSFKLSSNKKDMGLTLGTYGAGHGFYIVWPFLGPMSLRDSFGYVGDLALSPISYVGSLEGSLSLNVYKYFNKTSLHIGDYEDIKSSSLDPYVALRDAYIQHRNNLVKQESQ
ncbi:MAG: VacJ family lipoprotein [Nitrospirae bacterium]|nr:VacJ family lipoprotein [Nitrospirota bacterium]